MNAQTVGNYPITLRYAKSLPNDSTLSIYVNGIKVKQTLLPARGDWDTWSDKIEILNLNAGSNTIAYSYDSTDAGAANLDCITLPE